MYCCPLTFDGIFPKQSYAVDAPSFNSSKNQLVKRRLRADGPPSSMAARHLMILQAFFDTISQVQSQPMDE